MKANAIGHFNPPRSRQKSVATVAARLVRRYMAKLDKGEIILVDGNDSRAFGHEGHALSSHIYINDPVAYRRIVTDGAIGAAESYILGEWTTDDLTTLIRILARNRAVLDEMQANLSLFKRLAFRLLHLLNRDTVEGSKKNICAHYDLGNDFFRTFLDPTMTYSAGLFSSPADSMEQASLNKIDSICRKLDLSSDDHLLEIGTGWGALALHAAEHYGCRVTTTTISEEQYRHALRLVEEKGLQDRITLLKQDYRQLTGQYDKLVSVEMIEAVGLDYLPTFFRQCSSLLEPDGCMLLQSITIADQHYETARRSVDFIQRYIFPGGALPSVTALTDTATRHTDLRSYGLQDITLHYAETLKRWREQFSASLPEIKRLGFEKQFTRMWDYYLCYCEGGFRERAIGCVQIQFHKPDYRGEI